MTGSLIVYRIAPSTREERATASSGSPRGGGELVYRDVRRLGTLLLLDERGWAAVRRARSAPSRCPRSSPRRDWCEAFAGPRQYVKKALMDQRLVVGVGNIYANEALFAAGIDPSRAGEHARRPPRWPRLHRRGPAHPQRGDRLQRDHLPRLSHRHRRTRQLPARADGLRARGRAVPTVRHSARRHPLHRRANHGVLLAMSAVVLSSGSGCAVLVLGARCVQGAGCSTRHPAPHQAPSTLHSTQHRTRNPEPRTQACPSSSRSRISPRCGAG